VEGGCVRVSVGDLGIGMTAEEIAHANARLADPPMVDVSVSRRMGLFVVGRLALRHGIRVQLRQQDSGGITAMVLLPSALLVTPRQRSAGYGVPFGDAGAGRQAATAGMQNLLDIPRQRGGTVSMFDPPPARGSAPRNGNHHGSSAAVTSWPEPPTPGDRSGWPSASSLGSGDSWSLRSMPSMPSMPQTSWGPATPPPDSEISGDLGPLRRFGRDDFDSITGPLPTAHSSPGEGEEDYLPIYASVESDWFRRVEPADGDEGGAGRGEAGKAEPRRWSSPADAGWQAAQ